MISVSVSIDVPTLDEGERFYSSAFGFAKVATPVAGVALLKAGTMTLCLLEKAAGTRPSPAGPDRRRYDRHWTPVHLDLHVDDLEATLARATAAGARVEQRFDHAEHGSAAFCSDPFGHGFCVLSRPG